MPGKKIISGQANAVVILPPATKAATVTVKLAGKTFPINEISKPCRVQIDTTTIPDGEYEATAVAQDESGAEVWKGSSKVTIDNAGKLTPGGFPPPARRASPFGEKPAAPGAPGEPPAVAPGPPADGQRGPGERPSRRGNRNRPGAASGQPDGGLAPLPPAMENGPAPEPSFPPDPASAYRPSPNAGPKPAPGGRAVPDPFALDRPGANAPVTVTELYDSKRLGFKLQYPAGWKVSDHTAEMKPKETGGFWVAFCSPEPTPKLTVNFRHKLLKKATTPESYAKFNPYLLDWARVSVNGKPAFETTQGSAEAKRTVHRKMIIDGKDIWMFNCIDQTGKPSGESKLIFDQIVNSFSRS
jgi:hypothetical protein